MPTLEKIIFKQLELLSLLTTRMPLNPKIYIEEYKDARNKLNNMLKRYKKRGSADIYDGFKARLYILNKKYNKWKKQK